MRATEMIKGVKTYAFICLLLLASHALAAKDYDTQLRTGIKLKKGILKNLDGSIEVQYRLKNNLLTYDKSLIEPELVYDIDKKWRVGFNYRLVNNQTRTYNIEYRHRSAVFLRYDRELMKDFEIKVRTMLQYGFDDFSNSLFDVERKLINRNRVTIEYDLFGTPIRPFAGYEFFYHINNTNGGIINQWRLSAGMDYRISNRSVLSASYLLNNDRIHPTTDDAHIVVLKLNYELR